MKKHKNICNILIAAILCIIMTMACSDGDNGFYEGGSNGSGTGGSMARFTLNEDYLYTVDSRTLRTFDLSNPGQPKYLDKKDQQMNFGIETIFSMDTLLFIGSEDGMYIYNITRREFPQQMSVTRHIRSCDPVVAQGNYAYITLNSENTWCGNTSNLLEIYDISDPYKPKLVKTETGFSAPRGLGVDNNILFICDKGIKLYDISNPEKPKWIDDFTHIPEAKNIDAYDVIPLNGLLLVTGADGLYQFDYSDNKFTFLSKTEINRK